VTVAPVKAEGALAAQISAVPNCMLARATSPQVSPAPETKTDCACETVGPSAAAKASNSSPGADVLKAGVVAAEPVASTLKLVSKTSEEPIVAVTVTETGGAVPINPVPVPVPVAVACAVKTCEPESPFVFQVLVYVVVEEVTGLPIGIPSTRNCTVLIGVLAFGGVAVAVSGTVPLTLAPGAGEVRVTVGGVESGCCCWRTVTVFPEMLSWVSVMLLPGSDSAKRCCGLAIDRNQYTPSPKPVISMFSPGSV
jgi:hypothetical protein